jgi:hypothetical protein
MHFSNNIYQGINDINHLIGLDINNCVSLVAKKLLETQKLK